MVPAGIDSGASEADSKVAAIGGKMAVGTEWGGHRAERVTGGDGAKGKEAGSGSGSVEGSAGGGWVREGRAAQVRRERAGQTDGAQTAQTARRRQANLWADGGARAGDRVQARGVMVQGRVTRRGRGMKGRGKREGPEDDSRKCTSEWQFLLRVSASVSQSEANALKSRARRPTQTCSQ